jgi:hypothetical protein
MVFFLKMFFYNFLKIKNLRVLVRSVSEAKYNHVLRNHGTWKQPNICLSKIIISITHVYPFLSHALYLCAGNQTLSLLSHAQYIHQPNMIMLHVVSLSSVGAWLYGRAKPTGHTDNQSGPKLFFRLLHHVRLQPTPSRSQSLDDKSLTKEPLLSLSL